MTAPSPGTSALQRLARRRPIALFLGLVFGLGYPVMFLPLLADRGIIPGGSLPAKVGLDVERASALLLVLVILLPVTVLVTALEGGRPAVRTLVRRATRWRFGAAWWAVIVLALPVTTIALALLLGDTLRAPTLAVLGGELIGIVTALVVIQISEEAAWAGFLQTRLERQRGFYLAALLTAVPFAAIHMPLQVINGVTAPADLAAAFALLTAFGFVFRAFAGLVMRGTGNSVLAVAVAHTIFNRANNTDGIAADVLVGRQRQTAALIATVLVTVLLGIALRRRTTKEERGRLDALSGDLVTG